MVASLLVLAALTVREQAVAAAEAEASADLTRNVLEELGHARTNFAVLEASQLRFLLWGEPEDVRKRDAAADRFFEAVERLKPLLAQEPESLGLRARLSESGQQRVDMARAIAQERVRTGLDRPWPKEGSRQALALGEQVMALTEQMRQLELRRLKDSLELRQDRVAKAVLFLQIAGIAAFLLLLPAYALAIEQANRRRRAERLLIDLVEHLPVTAWQIRRNPGGSRRFVFLRPTVVQERGFTADAARSDIDVVLRTINDEDRPRVVAAMDDCELQLIPFDQRYRIAHPDGTTHWLHSRAALRQERDGTIVWSGYWEDITARKWLEDALELANARLKYANRELEAFS